LDIAEACGTLKLDPQLQAFQKAALARCCPFADLSPSAGGSVWSPRTCADDIRTHWRQCWHAASATTC